MSMLIATRTPIRFWAFTFVVSSALLAGIFSRRHVPLQNVIPPLLPAYAAARVPLLPPSDSYKQKKPGSALKWLNDHHWKTRIDIMPPTLAYIRIRLHSHKPLSLLVLGCLQEEHEMTEPYMWLYDRTPSGEWKMRWMEPLDDCGAFIYSVQVMRVPGHGARQVAVESFGGDWECIAVFGFRGSEDRPKVLLGFPSDRRLEERQIGNRRGPSEVIARGWIPWMIPKVAWKIMPLQFRGHYETWKTMPPQLRGHLLAIRHYIYDQTLDMYVCRNGWQPDRGAEAGLTHKERMELRQGLKNNLHFLRS